MESSSFSESVSAVPEGRFEIVVSGSGGQGIILGGKLLAETAAVFSRRQAAMTPCYGPEVRGGVSSAELVIDAGVIDYPRIIRPNVMIAMSQPAMDLYGSAIGEHGLVIVNETLVDDVPSRFENVFSAPLTATAIREMKTPMVANMIALGAFAAITGLVSVQALEETIARHVPERVVDVDRRAVAYGAGLAEDAGFSWDISRMY